MKRSVAALRLSLIHISTADHQQQTTVGVVVVAVGLQVLVQVVDAVGQQGNLHFGEPVSPSCWA